LTLRPEEAELMTVREELASIYDRLTAPDRTCDECGEPPVDGCLATVQIKCGYLLYAVCAQCRETGTPKIRKEAERVGKLFVSENVAAILFGHQLDLKKDGK
jgi:hypothetical protein